MTAENPQSTEATPEFNQEANAKLEEVLKERGYQYEPVRGNYGGADEHSFWIKGITLQEGLDLARQFDQSSVMTPGGLAYTSGLVQPATGLNVNADINEYFSEVQRDGQNVRFQYDINWDGGYYILEHHSQARGLTKLDTEFSGTGKPGSENKVRQAYPEIFKNRIYMYRANPKAVEHGLGANR